jgi:hypothetical protein
MLYVKIEARGDVRPVDVLKGEVDPAELSDAAWDKLAGMLAWYGNRNERLSGPAHAAEAARGSATTITSRVRMNGAPAEATAMSEAPRKLLPDTDTLSRQAVAANPDWSVWVSANAGSGKTYVLATRVIRLLLAGTDPSRILCLTYTKTAAAEMKDRVFRRLGEWVTMPEDKLRRGAGRTGRQSA